MAQVSLQKQLPFSERVDWTLFVLWFALLSIGLIMVSSSSISFAAVNYGNEWFFAKRQAIYLGLGLGAAIVTLGIPVSKWQQWAPYLMITGFALLILVLLPMVGRRVNGSQRWISIAGFTIQVSEIVKFFAVMFFASFFARRYEELHFGWQGFLKPLGVVGLIVFFLLLQPDFGSAVVFCVTVFSMMFIAGVRMVQFSLLFVGGIFALGAMAILSPYRMQRLITFLDPWADQFNSGYQLTQSLIGFGRGEWFGLGLGNSIQKLFFLPEAHTDFIFAIIAEETGLIGAVAVLAIFAALIYRILIIAKNNFEVGKMFAALSTFGIAIIFSFQVFINVGVASGLLPTKGLTLPFISYGGSSLIVCCMLMGYVMRVQWELSVYVPKIPEVRLTTRQRLFGVT